MSMSRKRRQGGREEGRKERKGRKVRKRSMAS